MAEVSENRRGPGARLKAAREEKAWSKAETATRLHLSVSVLDELEGDMLRASVELPFMRGYLRNYAKLLGMPGDELVKSFDAQHRGRGEEQRVKPIVKHKHEPLDASSPLGYVVGLGLLVVVGGAYFWLNKTVAPETVAPAPELIATDADTEPAGVAMPETMPGEPVQDGAARSEPQDASLPVAAAQASAGEPATAEVKPAALPQPVPTQTVSDVAAAPPERKDPKPLAAAGSVPLVMSFTGDCWIKIEDANGTVLSRGLKRAGHAVNLAGPPPFKLILGNPGAVSMTFKGEAVDLSQYPANQVAKLQLGANG
ncbi:MAG: DUF4115 domain-containing protein [Gammaproteobacteria bacterium]|nr:DUF4115 domain-containing protein [Gammaproteobacteria bacterium]